LLLLLWLLLHSLLQDQSRPADFQKAEGLIVIPKEAEVAQLPIDKFKSFFGGLLGSSS
jgi:hypothetical protein